MGLLSKTEGELLNIEKLIQEIDFATMQADLVKAMEQGTRALEQINSEMKIEDVEKLMEDTEEAIAYQQEVSDILSGQLNQVDEDDVLEELALIEQEEADAISLAMPDAPTKELEQPEQEVKVVKAEPQKKKVALLTN